MIDATNSVPSASGGIVGSPSPLESERDAFLSLLLTQLKHQDPLSPLQAHEFASQLASFSTVEQLAQLNDELAFQTEGVLLSAQLSKTAFSAALLGRHLVAEGNQVVIPESGSGKIRVEVGGDGGEATLRLLDDAGKEIKTVDLGTVGAGLQTLDLPDGLEPGTYTYELSVRDADGNAVDVVTYTMGICDGVSFRDGRIVLKVGDIEIPLEMVSDITPASQGSSTEA